MAKKATVKYSINGDYDNSAVKELQSGIKQLEETFSSMKNLVGAGFFIGIGNEIMQILKRGLELSNTFKLLEEGIVSFVSTGIDTLFQRLNLLMDLYDKIELKTIDMGKTSLKTQVDTAYSNVLALSGLNSTAQLYLSKIESLSSQVEAIQSGRIKLEFGVDDDIIREINKLIKSPDYKWATDLTEQYKKLNDEFILLNKEYQKVLTQQRNDAESDKIRDLILAGYTSLQKTYEKQILPTTLNTNTNTNTNTKTVDYSKTLFANLVPNPNWGKLVDTAPGALLNFSPLEDLVKMSAETILKTTNDLLSGLFNAIAQFQQGNIGGGIGTILSVGGMLLGGAAGAALGLGGTIILGLSSLIQTESERELAEKSERLQGTTHVGDTYFNMIIDRSYVNGDADEILRDISQRIDSMLRRGLL